MNKILCILVVLIPLLTAGVGAVEVGGVELPDTLTVGDQELALNGAGLRKKAFIKVYAGGLYLAEASSDADAVIAADAASAVRMHFIYRKVSGEDLVEAWNEGFANAGAAGGPLQAHIDSFNAFFDVDAKKGDIYDVTYDPGTGIEVWMNGESKGTIDGGLEFKQAVFAIWLGEKPADGGLKSGMLGD